MNRDTEEFIELLTSAQSSVFGYIMSVCHNHGMAQDILQETNVTLWKKAEDFEVGTNFVAWACRIAYFHILNHRRKYHREQLVFDDDVFDYLAERQEHRATETPDRIKSLQFCLQKLPENHRDLIEARYRPDASVQAIAEEQGKTEGAISQTLFRIRAALQKCIESQPVGGKSVMDSKQRKERITKITSAWFDGKATDSELSELNELLKGDPDACESYLDLVETHAALTYDHAGDHMAEQLQKLAPFPDSGSKRSVKRGVKKSALVWLPLAAALALLASLPLVWNFIQSKEPMTEGGVAVISRLVDPQWSKGQKAKAVGETLQSGSFRLESGLVQIEFFSGASVILEGPAELNLVDEWNAACRFGKLLVSVPEPARGFTIDTADYRAVDLGTEFAISVAADGTSEVHVLEGEVRLDDQSGAALRTLTTGMGVRANGANQGFDALDSGASDFVTRRKLMSLAEDGWRVRYADWFQSRQELRQRPDSLAIFNFESQPSWDRKLMNQVEGKSGGAIIGAQWAEGRWPGKGALEFQRITDRVRISVPGEFEGLTLVASVRIQGFDRWLSSLLLTDGWDRGEIHWQISDKGELILGVSGSINAISKPIIQPRDLGRWLNIAVTVDRKTAKIRHFLNGQMVSEHQTKAIGPLRIGNAEIGNWQGGNRRDPIRSFNGKIDELLVLDRILTDEEIRELAGE